MNDAGLQDVPVRSGHQQGNAVQVPPPGCGDFRSGRGGLGSCGGLGIGIDTDVGDSVVVDEPSHRSTKPIQPLPTAAAEIGGHFLPGGADVAGLVNELVVPGGAAETSPSGT